MPKTLFEGYRPGHGDGGRWVGVVDDGRAAPKTNMQTARRSASSGRFLEVAPPKGGSAIRSSEPSKK